MSAAMASWPWGCWEKHEENDKRIWQEYDKTMGIWLLCPVDPQSPWCKLHRPWGIVWFLLSREHGSALRGINSSSSRGRLDSNSDFWSQNSGWSHSWLLFRVSTLLCMLFVRESSTVLRLVLCAKQSKSVPSSGRITPPCKLWFKGPNEYDKVLGCQIILDTLLLRYPLVIGARWSGLLAIAALVATLCQTLSPHGLLRFARLLAAPVATLYQTTLPFPKEPNLSLGSR